MSGDQILANAQALLGVRYLWGGNTEAGMDCSAYVSRAWGVSRHTTDSLHLVSSPISKDDLRPGDAMNLTKSQDPRGYGHVRLFAAWANAEWTRMWVYEETPPQSLYRVIAYAPRYTPMRRHNFEPASDAPLVAAPPQATAPPTAPVTPTKGPVVPPAPAKGPTARPGPPASSTPRPTKTPAPAAPRATTPRPAPATATPLPPRPDKDRTLGERDASRGRAGKR